MRNIVCISACVVLLAGCVGEQEQKEAQKEKTIEQKAVVKVEKMTDEKVQEITPTEKVEKIPTREKVEEMENNIDKEKMMEENENYNMSFAQKCTGAVVTTNKGVFELELYGADAPHAVANFCSLADRGFYDGVIFHRIIKGFMIQGGDPEGVGTGGPGYNIPDDVSPHSNVRGTISMANTGAPSSGGSQFFINTADNMSLDHDKEPLSSKHPVFGRVISGIDVIDVIENTETDGNPPFGSSKPVEDVMIESIELKM